MKYFNRTMEKLLMENKCFVQTKFVSLTTKKLTFIDVVNKNVLVMIKSFALFVNPCTYAI
jgi:hypothetical protein